MSDAILGEFLSPRVRFGKPASSQITPKLSEQKKSGIQQDVVIQILFDKQNDRDSKDNSEEGIIFLNPHQATKLGVRLIELAENSRFRKS